MDDAQREQLIERLWQQHVYPCLGKTAVPASERQQALLTALAYYKARVEEASNRSLKNTQIQA
jgi:hypothetical protein